MKTLVNIDGRATCFLLSQLCRNQFVFGYCEGIISELKYNDSLKDLYKHNAKKWIKVLEDFKGRYDTDIKRCEFSTDSYMLEEDGIMDAAYQFRKHIEEPLFYYEEALARIINKFRLPNANFLKKLATAKDLLNIISLINGMECHCEANIKWTSFLGRSNRLLAADHDREQIEPTTISFYRQAFENMNKAALKNISLPSQIRYEIDEDNDISLAQSISSKQITDALCWYPFFVELAKPNTTASEAAKHAREAEERANLIAAKREYKKGLKNGK